MNSGDITSDDKLWAVLSYLLPPLISIIVLLMEDKKSRPFIKYHAVNALAVSVILYVITTVTCGFGAILFLVMLWWAYQSYQGQWFEIPVVTNFCKQRGWC
jgi:uncharacterized membrane protein